MKKIIIVALTLCMCIGGHIACGKTYNDTDLLNRITQLEKELADIKKNGPVKGDMGIQGDKGDEGLSAYEIYKKYHSEYTGSEEQWISDLINDKLLIAVEYLADKNGGIYGKANQIVSNGASSSVVIAVPGTGYQFAGWSDGVKTAARQDFDITQAISVTAAFVEDYFVFDPLYNGTSYAARVLRSECNNIIDIIIPAYFMGLPVREIAYNGFWGCENLETVALPETVILIGNNAFADCEKLKKIDLCNVIVICPYAFDGCNSLKNIIIPLSVALIAEEAFPDNSGLVIHVRSPYGYIKTGSGDWDENSGHSGLAKYTVIFESTYEYGDELADK